MTEEITLVDGTRVELSGSWSPNRLEGDPVALTYLYLGVWPWWVDDSDPERMVAMYPRTGWRSGKTAHAMVLAHTQQVAQAARERLLEHAVVRREQVIPQRFYVTHAEPPCWRRATPG